MTFKFICLHTYFYFNLYSSKLRTQNSEPFMLQQSIFNDKSFLQKLSNYKIESIPDYDKKIAIIEKYNESLKSGRIERTKEESIKADFINNFFGSILGYEFEAHSQWNLEKEFKSVTDATKPDAALGFFSISPEKNIKYDVRVVIEIKDAQTDLDKRWTVGRSVHASSVEQAFSYASKSGGNCNWVIVSNFREIRLYHSSDQGKYELFEIESLLNPEYFRRFYFLLSRDHLTNESGESFVEHLYKERQQAELEISKKFYAQYKLLRLDIFNSLITNNHNHDKLFLLEKTQKILDRFIFVCFCKDAGLIPQSIISNIKDVYIKSIDRGISIWRQLTALFNSIDKGNPPLDINKFNGGLFANDIDLDKLIVKDDVLLKLLSLSEYDFSSDLNVNILGHIFEQSISDIEEIKSEIIANVSHPEDVKHLTPGKRKKEGIFYTPEYITRYIVKEAIGSWLDDRKQELGFIDLPELSEQDYKSVRTLKKKKGGKSTKIEVNKNIDAHLKFWEAYKEKLLNIKVLDPACGSGAFLNQVFDFLYKEGQSVNDEISKLKGGQREAFELDRHILTNNIFGVDLNSESVEITKLSLWLKTANKGKQLTSLDKNILCGNSLIDDKDVAGDKAFNWFLSFPQVFPYFRIPKPNDSPLERGTRGVSPEPGDKDFLDELEEPSNISSYFPLEKNQSSRAFVTRAPDPNDSPLKRDISRESGVRGVFPLSTDNEQLSMNAKEPTYSYKSGSTGFDKYGFDVIIGNPPYVTAEYINELDKEYFSKNYKSAFGRINIFPLFYEKAIHLSKHLGLIGFITPYTILKNQYFIQARRFILNNTCIKQIVDFQNTKIFEEAVVDSVILILKKDISDNAIVEVIGNINNFSENDFSIKTFKQQSIHLHDDLSFINGETNDLFTKIFNNTKKVSEVIDFNQGIITGNNKKFVTNIKTELSKPIVTGSDFNRYSLSYSGYFIEYSNALHRQRTKRIFEVPEKILLRQTGSYPVCTIDTNSFYTLDTVHNGLIIDNDYSSKYLLCLFNSKLMRYIYEKQINEVGKVFAQVKIIYINELPIKIIDSIGQQPFIEKADIMLAKNKELQELRNEFLSYLTFKYSIAKPSTKLSNWYELNFKQFSDELKKATIKLTSEEEFSLKSLFDTQRLKAQSLLSSLSQTDKAIDSMVYTLYGLTNEEIDIIEKI